MDSTHEILHDFSPAFRVYKDGRVERLSGTDTVPASVDLSKDVIINANSGVSARLYLPKSIDTDQKLPLVVYFHGGCFVVDTAFSPLYHTHLNHLVAESNIVIVSVDYRRAPEHPLPIAYEDSWGAVQWVASHSSRNGQDPWLNMYADFQSSFFAGDSVGANIAHNMAVRASSESPDGLSVSGIVLVHSFFWAKEAGAGQLIHPQSRAFVEKLWLFVNPCSSGLDDPFVNPDPRNFTLGCKRVIIFVAEREMLKHWGLYYKELLEQIGWGGKVEVVETKDEDHIFHIDDPTTHKAKSLVKSVASFVNEGKTVCVPCPEFRRGTCRQEDACVSGLHLAQYCTWLCKDEIECNRKVCVFTHKREELPLLYTSTGSGVSAASSSDFSKLKPLTLGSPSIVKPHFSNPMISSGQSTPIAGSMLSKQSNFL